MFTISLLSALLTQTDSQCVPNYSVEKSYLTGQHFVQLCTKVLTAATLTNGDARGQTNNLHAR